MIIEKRLLNIANLVSADASYPGLIIKKGKKGIVELYATDGYMLLKVTAMSFSHDDYPILPNENFDYSEVEDFCVEITKETVEQLKKIIKKSHIPILNSIFISEVFDAEKEEGYALATDLSSTNKIKFSCKKGEENFNKIKSFIMKHKDNHPDISKIDFDPFKMINLLKCMCDILGITKKDWESVNLTLGSDKLHPINLYIEKDGVQVEAYLMPTVV